MMTLHSLPPSRISGPQRRCQLLLMLYIPSAQTTPEALSNVDGVDREQALQDIADLGDEIQRYHRLALTRRQDGSYRITGPELNRRLCLLHYLRRGLRLCPSFVQQYFSPALHAWLRQQNIAQGLYEEPRLTALINLCARRLQRQFDPRDRQFLTLFLQYCLYRNRAGMLPQLSENQRSWCRRRPEYQAASMIDRHWRRRVIQPLPEDELLFLALLFQLLRVPDPQNDDHPEDLRLHAAIASLVERFRQLAGMTFSDEQALKERLYLHLSQALDRCRFAIGIDNGLPEEVVHLYPRLIRTTRAALRGLEADYQVQFSEQETGLVAVTFGAWLMQESEIQEKQILLLTANDPALEQKVERQLRELTLLPLNIKYRTVQQYQQEGAPPEVVLVIAPYSTALPLLSPPLIHATPLLGPHQQQQIKAILEA